MCFYSEQSKEAIQLEHRFDAKFADTNFLPGIYNGFAHPQTPVITNENSAIIRNYQWGLIPPWAKDDSIKKMTLNARIETIETKPAFKGSVQRRCLVLADGFYEWQWLDPKGKQKQKYLLTLPGEEAFGFAGLWNDWTDRSTGEVLSTYTILTTAANELMGEIHNNKKRMPVILSKAQEKNWLMGDELEMDNDRLVAGQVDV